MEQPTKEEIDDMVATINRDGLEGLTKQEVRELCAAYLALREEVKEADRKAGEARRHWEYMRDRQHAHDDWLRKAKEQWGVHENTSFDVVWNECLQLKADNEALREACNVVLEYFETGVTVESEAFSDYVRSLHPRWDVRYE